MREGYAVQLLKWGEPILTIEHTCLSGKELDEDESRVCWEAGQSLQNFVCDPDAPHTCFVCGGVNECKDDCQLTIGVDLSDEPQKPVPRNTYNAQVAT